MLTREVGKRAFIPQRSGKIIVTASIAGLRGNPPGMGTIAYNASKGADVNFVRALAAEWGKYNINVNAICPGYIVTELNEQHWETEAGRKLVQLLPRKRLGQAQDLDGLLVLLASEQSGFINLSLIHI